MNSRHPSLYFILFLGAACFGALGISWQWSETVFAIEMPFLSEPQVRRAGESAPSRKKPEHQTVKAVYLTAYSAGSPKKLADILDLIERTELNAVVVDIKDYSGYVLYDSSVPLVERLGTKSVRIRDLAALVSVLHERGVYAIARQTVFQDPVLAEKKPEWAFHRKGGGLWRDRKGLAWVNPANGEVWHYNLAIAKEAIRAGFDEINFDYVRFPSDGNMATVAYTHGNREKHDVMRDFYAFMSEELADWPALLSLDMFGLVMERHDGMSIGQRLEDAADYADYIAPMMYPSHYAIGHLGFQNPAEHPGEVFANGMKKGLPHVEGKRARIRPWIQAFNLGAVYDGAKIRAQIDEIEKTGDAGWMMWNAANRYTDAGLKLSAPTVYESPVTLSGDETMVIENAHVVFKNSITLRDRAQLIIRRSRVRHEKEYALQYGLFAYDDSRVVVEESVIGNECNGSLNWSFHGRSRLETSGVTQTECNIWHLLADDASASIVRHPFNGTVCDRARLAVEKGQKMELELCLPSGAEVDEILPRETAAFSFPNENDSGVPFSLSLRDSTVDGWGISLAPKQSLTLRDSRVTAAMLVGPPWKNASVVLSGLRKGHYKDREWQVADSRLRLINSTVYGWEANVFGVGNALVVQDSELSASNISSGNGVLRFEHSTIGTVTAQEKVSITLVDSTVTGDAVAKDEGTITLENSVIKGRKITEGEGRITD